MQLSPQPQPAAGKNEMYLADDEADAEASADEVAIIFSFLHPEDILRLRRVCTTWRDAAKKTLVPPTDFSVDNERSYNAMRVMATALPDLQQLYLGKPGRLQLQFLNGEDHHRRHYHYGCGWASRTANMPAHDISILTLRV